MRNSKGTDKQIILHLRMKDEISSKENYNQALKKV